MGERAGGVSKENTILEQPIKMSCISINRRDPYIMLRKEKKL